MTEASPPTDALLEELAALALEAARDAARFISEERPAGLGAAGPHDGELIDTKSTGTDLVTVMDRAAEQRIRARLSAARPGDAIVGEEHGETTGDTGIVWWVDPIDGTTNYVYDHAGYAVSIAAARVGDPGALVGVVVDPGHGDEFTAVAGGGAYRNGTRLRLPAPPDPARALVATGFAYEADRRQRQGEAVARLLPRIRDIRRMGAASVDLCSVACGRVDAYFEAGLSRWDYAAGGLIAAEAGAIVTAMDGGPVRPGSVLAAHPELHRQLLGLLDEVGAARLVHG